jgi:hypothetical protein
LNRLDAQGPASPLGFTDALGENQLISPVPIEYTSKFHPQLVDALLGKSDLGNTVEIAGNS